MYRIGQDEIDELKKVIDGRQLFRYGIGDQCDRFEARYAERLGVDRCILTASGTNALTAALVAAGIGPGSEVLVPACTFMATPIAVLAAGAIPVVVDIDESIAIDPDALRAAIGPRTRAVIPVHMWGLPADMDSILEIAEQHDLVVIEDACQGVGGAYEGRMLGSMGHLGCFSFNYYKNMTAGEGGAVVTSNSEYAERMQCVIDSCNFYWNGRENSFTGFVYNGARASEFQGAILNIQLDRIDGMIELMRSQKKQILDSTAGTGLRPIPANSPDWECGTHVMYRFDSPEQAETFAAATEGTVAIKTGRHVYTEWDPILEHRGAPFAALDPFQLAENADCRMDYSHDMCRRSLDILSSTVFIQTHPDRTEAETDGLIKRIVEAAKILE